MGKKLNRGYIASIVLSSTRFVHIKYISIRLKYHQFNTQARTAESVSLFIGEQRHHLFILLLSGNSSCNSTNQKSHSSCRNSYSNKTICTMTRIPLDLHHDRTIYSNCFEKEFHLSQSKQRTADQFISPLAILSSIAFFREIACLQSG